MTTKQAKDMNRNPSGKGGFGDNPENRNSGSWKKTDTARFKLEQMMKLSQEELQEVIRQPDIPVFEQKLALAIRDGDWKVIREITHEVYGTPKQSVDVNNPDGSLTPIVRVIDERKKN